MHTLRGWIGIVSVYLHVIGVRKKREEGESERNGRKEEEKKKKKKKKRRRGRSGECEGDVCK